MRGFDGVTVNASILQNALNKGRFAVCVRLPIKLEHRGQPVLQRSVLTRERLIAANLIAECHALDPTLAAHWHEMEMMCSECSGRLAEPMHDVRSIGEVNVASLNDFVNRGSRCF